MAHVYLLIGGNLGDRESTLMIARERITHLVGNIEQESGIYETEPWEIDTNQLFLNQLLNVNTNLSAEAVLKEILQIEHDLGRQRKNGQMGSRTMDIDILFYDDLIFNGTQLTIPHPRLHLRKFALIPLNEIAEYMIHPSMGKSMKALLQACEDKQEVKLLVN